MDTIEDSLRSSILEFAERLKNKYTVSYIYFFGS